MEIQQWHTPLIHFAVMQFLASHEESKKILEGFHRNIVAVQFHLHEQQSQITANLVSHAHTAIIKWFSVKWCIKANGHRVQDRGVKLEVNPEKWLFFEKKFRIELNSELLRQNDANFGKGKKGGTGK